MFVRLVAVLLALGMLVISAQASELATPDTTAIVDDADEVPALTLIEVTEVVSDQPPAHTVLPAPSALVGHRPEIMIFRPPRAAAFV